jgi:hypothetical protein
MFVAALTGSEAALAVAPLWIALELSVTARPWPARWRACLPVIGISLGYLAGYAALAGGTRASGGYHDPMTDPLGFARVAAIRVPVLLGDAALGIPAELAHVVAEWRLALIGLAAVGVLALAWRWTATATAAASGVPHATAPHADDATALAAPAPAAPLATAPDTDDDRHAPGDAAADAPLATAPDPDDDRHAPGNAAAGDAAAGDAAPVFHRNADPGASYHAAAAAASRHAAPGAHLATAPDPDDDDHAPGNAAPGAHLATAPDPDDDDHAPGNAAAGDAAAGDAAAGNAAPVFHRNADPGASYHAAAAAASRHAAPGAHLATAPDPDDDHAPGHAAPGAHLATAPDPDDDHAPGHAAPGAHLATAPDPDDDDHAPGNAASSAHRNSDLGAYRNSDPGASYDAASAAVSRNATSAAPPRNATSAAPHFPASGLAEQRRTIAWLVLGGIGATVLGATGFPAGRVLVIPNLAFAPLVGLVLYRGLAARWAGRAMAGVLAVIHLVIAPAAALRGVAKLAHRARVTEAIAAHIAELAPPLGRVIIVAASDPMVYVYPRSILADVAPGTVRCWSVWSAAHASHRVTRTGTRTLVIEPIERTMLDGSFDELYRAPGLPFAAGDTVQQCGATIRVAAVRAGRPARLEIELRRPLDDPEILLLVWSAHRLVRFTPPRIGETIEVPWSAGPSGVL